MFYFTKSDEIPKFAKLIIYTSCKNYALTFTDSRGFGKWIISGKGQLWDSSRGPDPIKEYDAFRDKVLNNLTNKAFKGSICESMLNQQFFNGIGNYLRAEILFRADIDPFKPAHTVFEELKQASLSNSSNVQQLGATNQTNSDLLQLCKEVPEEVIKLEINKYADDNSKFVNWCLCYGKSGMLSKKDKNNRVIWYNPKYNPSASTDLLFDTDQQPPFSKRSRGSGGGNRGRGRDRGGRGRSKDQSNAIVESADISINSKVIYDDDDDDNDNEIF